MYKIKQYNHPMGEPNKVWEEIWDGKWFGTKTKAKLFPSLPQAVAYFHSIHSRFHTLDRVWIEGPKGGRYNPITGKKL